MIIGTNHAAVIIGTNHDKEDKENTWNWSRSCKQGSRWFSRQVSKARAEEEQRRNEALDYPKRLVVWKRLTNRWQT